MRSRQPAAPKGHCACGCGQLAQVRGYRSACYQRARLAGTLDTRPRTSDRPLTCAKCDGVWYCKGLCRMHYRRVRGYRTLGEFRVSEVASE